MRADHISLTCSKLEEASLVGFRAKEAVSRPYEVDVYFTVPTGTSVRAAVGERATLKVDRAEGAEPLFFHGVFASTRLLHQTAERALYHALLVPKLWLLRHFWRSFVFTGKTVQQFLEETLKAGGLASSDYRFSIDAGRYPEEEFVAQYRESLLDFFHRWCEREGLYYFFEHADGAPGEKLVVVDSSSLHEDFPGGGRVRYAPILGDDATAPPGLHTLEADVRWLPKTVTIADYNYANPAASVKSDSLVTSKGLGTIREYGFRVFDEGGAQRLAEVRAQSIGCREVTLRATGSVVGPRAGYRFAIDDKPEDLEETWLAIEVEHEASLAGATAEVRRLTGLPAAHAYRMKVFAVPSAVQYRAPQETAWPRIYGFENAVVGGPADSPYAQIDADGRYLVRFEFDTSDLPDADVSTRVRMLQPHGGSSEGFHFPLRKGTEVMIGFLGGDPDRPFIAGVVPNAHRPSVVGERNRTQNIIRTGSGNQIVMEDEQGKEFMFLQTPNNRTGIYIGHPATGSQSKVYTGDGERPDMFTKPDAAQSGDTNDIAEPQMSLWQTTDGNYGVRVFGDSWKNVWGNENGYVYGPASYGYGQTFNQRIGGNTTEWFGGTHTTTNVHGRNETISDSGLVQDITNKLHQAVHGSGHLWVDSAWHHKVGTENHDEYGSWKSDVTGTWTATIGGNISVTSSNGTILLHSPTKITLQAPEIKNDTGSHWKISSSFAGEIYPMKNSIGGVKMDQAGVSYGYTVLKAEIGGVGVASAVMKSELCGFKIGRNGYKDDTSAADTSKGAAKINNWAMKIFSCGIVKL